MTKMNEKLRSLWLAALTSGDYAQTRARLQRTQKSGSPETEGKRLPGYCCLGVLCEVARKNDLVPEGFRVEDTPNGLRLTCSYDESWIDEWSFGTHCEDWGLTENEQDTLTQANDQGETFEQIASIIVKDDIGLGKEQGR